MLNKKQTLYYAILFIFPILFFVPLLMSDSIMTCGDGIGYEAQFEMIRIALGKGQFPQWNPFVANGTPFAADIQNKVFYPLVYLCLLFPRHLDYKVFYILHIILNAVFSFNLFKKLVKYEPIAFYGAIITSFSNLIILRQDHINILCTIVWIPLLAQLIIQLCETKARKYAACLGIAMALQFLAGFPQIAFYTDIILVLLYIYLSINKRVKPGVFLLNGLIITIFYIGIAAIQMLPLVELMIYSGRSNISYEYFANGASDFRYLLNLLNPVFWGEWGTLLYEGLEFPTDLYIGIIPLTLAVYSLIYCRGTREIKVLSWIAAAAFTLACACNNIPILGKILYKIPLLGSFRTLTRFLIFFSGPLLWMGVIGLKHIVENNAYRKIRKISMGILGIYIILCGTCFILSQYGLFSAPAWNEYFSAPKWFCKSLVVLIVAILLWTVFCQKSKGVLNAGRPLVLVLSILVISLWDTYFYNTDPAGDIFRQNEMLRYGNHESIFDTEETAYLTELPETEQYKYFVSYESWEDLAETSWSIRVNGNVFHRLSSIQSYITFNHPLLLQLCGADYGMMMSADSVMALTNPTFLQMLSTKYIIVNNQSGYAWNGTATVYEQYPLERDGNTADGIPVPADLDYSRTNTVHVHIHVESGEGLLSIMLGNEVLYSQKVVSGDNFVRYTIPADSKQTEALKLQLSGPDMDAAQISGIRIEENCDIGSSMLYREVFRNDRHTIIESLNAKPLIYSPQKVVCMDNCENFIVENKTAIDFAEISYIEEGTDLELTDADTKIEITDIRPNSVSANVHAAAPTWINLSQSPYRGWSVYVDGVKQESIKVNGIIQGTPLEAGSHTVTFRFSSPTVFWGAAISAVAWIAALLYLIHANKSRFCFRRCQ